METLFKNLIIIPLRLMAKNILNIVIMQTYIRFDAFSKTGTGSKINADNHCLY